jgi:hypothetical protein
MQKFLDQYGGGIYYSIFGPDIYVLLYNWSFANCNWNAFLRNETKIILSERFYLEWIEVTCLNVFIWDEKFFLVDKPDLGDWDNFCPIWTQHNQNFLAQRENFRCFFRLCRKWTEQTYLAGRNVFSPTVITFAHISRPLVNEKITSN